MKKEKYTYDYASKCDCSEDDNCGCTYPNNMTQNFSCEIIEENEVLITTSKTIKNWNKTIINLNILCL